MAKTFDNSNKTRFINIMGSRKLVTLAMAGQSKSYRVQSFKYDQYNEKLDAQVDIYNLNATKQTVKDSQWYKDTLAAAKAIEAAGDIEESTKLFNLLLNRTQLTFNVINRSGKAQRFVKGQIVTGSIETAEAADRDNDGEDLGTTHTTVVINNVYAPVITMDADNDTTDYAAEFEEAETA